MTVLTRPLRWLGNLVRGDAGTRAQKELKDQLKSEANYYANVIQKRLTRMGLCYRYPKSKDDFIKKGTQEVEFVKAVGTPEAVYLMVDTIRLPRKVTVGQLAQSQILNDLSVNCGRPVRFRHKVGSGAWFIIERDSGVWGVPKRIAFGKVLNHWPDNTPGKDLMVPLGVGENRELFYRSLAKFPHALVAGSTGAGKSTMMHGWICALALKNQPGDVRFALVDLKGGTEFTRYKKLPHVIDEAFMNDDLAVDGFIKDADDVLPMLHWMQKQMDYRLHRFEQAGGIQNLSAWNYRRRNDQWPRLVLFVDELAVLMLSDVKKEAKNLLADISARGRAPGIHLVLATQRPEVKIIPGLIKANIDARFAFRVTDNASSMVILDTTEAARFAENTPRGRYIYRSGLEKRTLQAPWITPGQMKRIISDVIEGVDADDGGYLPPEEIWEFALAQMNGSLSERKLYDALPRGRVSRTYLRRTLRDFEGEIVEVRGEMYELVPHEGSVPRRLVRIGDGG